MPPTTDFDEYAAARWPRLVRAGWWLTGDWPRAEDLAQSALTSAWRHWGRVSAADDPDRYVRKILVNEYLDVRHRWRTDEPFDEAYVSPVGGDDAVVAERDALARALREVPPGQRAVLVLRYYLDLSEQDTAAALGCSVGNVKSQGARGLARLREVYDVVGRSS